MSSAASAATPAQERSTPSPRRARSSISRRAGLQLLAGLLVVAGIPVVATVRILDVSAVRNERAHADAALRSQLQQAADVVQGLADDASTRADDMSRSAVLQRAFLTNDRATIVALARKNPGVLFYLHGEPVTGAIPSASLTRSVSLALNGTTVGRVVATVPLGTRLERKLLHTVAHAHGDRLLIVRRGVAVGSGRRVDVAGRDDPPRRRTLSRRPRSDPERAEDEPARDQA